MFKLEMQLNGRKITSAVQLERELGRSTENHIQDRLKKVAGSGARLKTTRDGYVLEGPKDQIERIKQKLRRNGNL